MFSNGIFDRENKNKYYITIEATDDSGKGLSISRELIVEIADENDNAPKFSQNDYKMEFNEESQHRFIVQVFFISYLITSFFLFSLMYKFFPIRIKI